MIELNENESIKKTTIALSVETKDLLADLKKARNQPDYNATIQLLINQITDTRSDSAIIHLEMTPAKYRWLEAGQRNVDYFRCLRDAKR